MKKNDTVLNGRYSLIERINMPEFHSSEHWEALDSEGEVHTLKITPYIGNQPPSEIRRMWDNDLRIMYRLSSSAGAAGQLVVMKDAGIDFTANAMILVYEGSQYVTFADNIKSRDKSDWLSFRKLKERHIRRVLWASLLQLARGLKSLHDQKLVHRNVTPEVIWGYRDDGPASLRLSGFDWSARIGHFAHSSERSPWATPPELKHVGHSFGSDWYGFGTTIARCFHKVEHLRAESPDNLAKGLAEVVSRENPCKLEALEKDFIKELTAPDRIDRVQRSTDILCRIEKILEALDFGQKSKAYSRRVALYLNPKRPEVVSAAKRAGFMINPDDPFIAFDPDSDEHVVRLKDFIADQLRTASLSWSQDGRKFELKCNGFYVFGERWMDFGESKAQSWRAAKAFLNASTRLVEAVPAMGFDDVSIEVEFDTRQVGRIIMPGSGYTAWDAFAPKSDTSGHLDQDSENVRQFLHASNQLEILLRDAELFKYELIEQVVDPAEIKIIIAPVDEDRPSRRFFKAEKKLLSFLQQELESGKKYCEYVFLTDSDSLFVPRDFSFRGSQDQWVEAAQWTISDIDLTKGTVTLFRKNVHGISPLPIEGYLRTRGHYGQIRLIERRKKAIERLSSHSYLLRSLASPAFTPIDAGKMDLPWRRIEDVSEDGKKIIDDNKLAIIKDILRMRPMYALQGPPGTGKSTLVAHLLRQILEEDPMAQILVTAKDHAAVDVLLDKVIRQAYKGAPEQMHPIAIRLNRRDGKDNASELVHNLVRIAREACESQGDDLSVHINYGIRNRWVNLLKEFSCEHSAKAEGVKALENSLLDLVRRGASITYCTTSAGDLEELAKGSRSFDWSIIEEAGKTHGFDLALPLQAGHRWLLLGDQKQLRPFLYKEFADCLNNLRGDGSTRIGAIEVLDELKSNRANNRIIDVEWLKRKSDFDSAWAESFENFALGWLASFSKIFDDRQRLNGVTQGESIGASAGLLTSQYRMPPAIGDLNSSVFYNGELGNATGDVRGNPDADHCSPFLVPQWLAGKSLIWLDMPLKQENAQTKEPKGYSNSSEKAVISRLLDTVKVASDKNASEPHTIAILTPYNMQRNAINSDPGIRTPAGCQFGSAQGRDPGLSKAFSVDSFQGDEADIIIVSLVRNKLDTIGIPEKTNIEFIAQPDRLNVMLSRAKRVMIIVGCWDYISACVSTVSSAQDQQGKFNDPEYGPLKKALEELDAMFKDGRAVKISAEKALP